MPNNPGWCHIWRNQIQCSDLVRGTLRPGAVAEPDARALAPFVECHCGAADPDEASKTMAAKSAEVKSKDDNSNSVPRVWRLAAIQCRHARTPGLVRTALGMRLFGQRIGVMPSGRCNVELIRFRPPNAHDVAPRGWNSMVGEAFRCWGPSRRTLLPSQLRDPQHLFRVDGHAVGKPGRRNFLMMTVCWRWRR